jgi:DNA-binding transcriptional regulator YiaG
MTKKTPELTDQDFASSLKRSQRARLMRGQFEGGEDIVALRKFVRLTQKEFDQAIGISIHTFRNWEQGRRKPEGPALALLRIAARHPKIVRENAPVKHPHGSPPSVIPIRSMPEFIEPLIQISDNPDAPWDRPSLEQTSKR